MSRKREGLWTTEGRREQTNVLTEDPLLRYTTVGKDEQGGFVVLGKEDIRVF